MARRTIQAIYDAFIAEKESNALLTGLSPAAGENANNLLADLTSGSKVAIWRLLFWIHAVGVWIHEGIFEQHAAEVNATADELITGPPIWYQQQALLFQYGDNLTWTGRRYIYDPVTTANRIVKRSAAIELEDETRLLRIKVAKLDGAGLPIPLSTPETSAFSYYMNLIKFGGTNLEVVSQLPDLLKIFADIVYNPLVLSPTGELIATPGTFPVIDAINAFVQNLPFDGVLHLDNLVAAIKLATGVVNVNITTAQAMEVLTAYLDIDRTLGYNAAAGYMVIDPAFPLATGLTYISQPQ